MAGTLNKTGFKIWILTAVALLLYLPSVWFDYTQLDDYIFIFKDPEYNKHLSNLFTSFSRGVFDPVNDSYYRPLFLDSIVLNYQFCGTSAWGYHLVNVLLHALTVTLVYRLLLRLKINEQQAFLLTLFFTVLPVFTQAVVWIPGRNDVLLAVFLLPFFLRTISWTETGSWQHLLIASVYLLLAFFTKETTVFALPAALLLLTQLLGQRLFSRNMLLMYATWAGCFIGWYAMRAHATMDHIALDAPELVSRFVFRLPLIVQYLGKIFLPLHLSVFPLQQDTAIYPGIIACGLLVAGLVFATGKPNYRYVIAGTGIFLLFLVPAMIIPGNVNEQTFEHRLYLPVIGLLLLLQQTALFTRLRPRNLTIVMAAIAMLMAAVSFTHQYNFKDTLSFWRQAAATSPNSAAANMMLGQRLPDGKEAYRYFRKAYALDPEEKFINLCYATMLQEQDSVLASEPYIKREMELSGYPGLDIMMAKVGIKKQDTAMAAFYLRAAANRGEADTTLQKVWYSYYRGAGNATAADSLLALLRTRKVNMGDTLK